VHLSFSDINRERQVWKILESVWDPELPVLSVVDLGIVRYVRYAQTAATGPDAEVRRTLHVGITPTYSGCPATEAIRDAVREALDRNGYADAVIEEMLNPPWTSEWLTEAGRQKLTAFGIAPPEKALANPRHLFKVPVVACPLCNSRDTERVSEFGSTPCKAHYRCVSCREPFDYFKCL
jgi:ring-1,2-phenylacetyl-CoA epoxidase subunit PaaD